MYLETAKRRELIRGVLKKNNALVRFIEDEGKVALLYGRIWIPYGSKMHELYDRVCAINRMEAKRGHYIWDDIDKGDFVRTAYQVAVEILENFN